MGHRLSIKDDLIPIIAEYLTDINCKKSTELIALIMQFPNLAEQTIPTILDYYSNKYTICSVVYNNKILYYYVTS